MANGLQIAIVEQSGPKPKAVCRATALKRIDLITGQHSSKAVSLNSSFFAFGACVSVVLDFGFVATDLPVQFVRQFIDGGIQISMRAFSK